MAVFITYDVSGKHIAMKEKLEDLDYTDWVQGKTSEVNLPNTTMRHETKSAAEGRTDMQGIAKDLGIKLQRAIAFEIRTWAAIPGEPHS